MLFSLFVGTPYQVDEITTVTMTALHEAPTVNELPNTISISSLQVYHESVTDNSHVESTVLEGEIYDNDAQSTVSQLFIDDIQRHQEEINIAAQDNLNIH